MLSSYNSSCCNDNPTHITTNFSRKDIITSTTSISKSQDYSSFFSFPNSPNIEYEHVYLQFLELLSHNNPQLSTTAPPLDHDQIIATPKMDADSSDQINNLKEEKANANAKVINKTANIHHHHHYQPTITTATAVRKRCSTKDRHSKINTARGPRDRRMRLSLAIARRFFDLQDLLGYDKASRTVDWLLRNSTDAIVELARGRVIQTCSGLNSASSTCEDFNEVVSSSPPPPSSSCTKVKKKQKVKSVGRATIARESRRKARERARERTSQRRRLTNYESCKESKMFGDVSVFSHIYDLQATDELAVDTTWNPCTVINYDQDNAVFLHQDHEQIAEFHFSGKPWEAYNSFNLSG